MVSPELYFTDAYTGENGRVAAGEQKRKAKDALIQSVEWVTHGNPSEAAELYDPGPGSLPLQAHPDALAPGQSARTKVDVRVHVTPQIPNIPIVLGWRDVDDPTDHDGPIDDDPDPTPDGMPPNGSDNFSTSAMGDPSLPPNPRTTDANGQVRVTFDIGDIQPGNNFRVVAAARQQKLDRVLARSADDDSEVFFDENGNGLYNSGEPTLVEVGAIHGTLATRMLTIWRYLHVEVDSMGPVAGNTVHNVAGTVTESAFETWLVPLTDQLDQDDAANRFQGGTLCDSQGYHYHINWNTANTVLVDLSGNVDPPMSNADVWLYDDDYLKDGWDVPMPDTSQLDDALGEAFVVPVFDVGDNNDNVPFVLHSSHDPNHADYVVNSFEWGSKAQNSVPYWVAYVLAGFQGPADKDYDPDDTPVYMGATSQEYGGSMVYIESVRDRAVDMGWDPSMREQDLVVHEVGHAVSDSQAEPVTRFENEGIYGRYTDA